MRQLQNYHSFIVYNVVVVVVLASRFAVFSPSVGYAQSQNREKEWFLLHPPYITALLPPIAVSVPTMNVQPFFVVAALRLLGPLFIVRTRAHCMKIRCI